MITKLLKIEYRTLVTGHICTGVNTAQPGSNTARSIRDDLNWFLSTFTIMLHLLRFFQVEDMKIST